MKTDHRGGLRRLGPAPKLTGANELMLPGGALEQASTADDSIVDGGFLPRLDASAGGEVSLLEGSFGASVNDSGSLADTIDTRRFKKGAQVFMRGGLAVEKTILNVWRTKTSTESRDNISLSSGSIGAISVGPGFFRTSQFNTLSNEERLLVNIWNAFKKHSVQQGDNPCDAGSRSIPVQSLVSAVLSISKTLPPAEVIEIVRSRQYASNAMLSMQEFRSFIESIFSTKAPPLTMTGIPDPLRMHGAARAEAEASGMSPTPDPRDPNAYHRLQQKQRGASSVVFATLPQEVTTEIGTSESITDLNGQKVSTQTVNSAMLAVLKNQSKHRNKELREALKSNDPDLAAAAQIAKQASITEPLLKHKVYGMAHGNETYAAKWERMKAKRDDRMGREMKRAARSETIEAINRLVLTSEKRAIKQFAEVKADVDRQLAREKVASRIVEESQVAERIRLRAEEEQDKRLESASSLRSALEEASLLTQSLHEDELAEKKAAITPFALNPSSSALVKVPDELVIRVSKARTLEGWKAAKKAERDFWENTLDSRIKRFAYAKYDKMLRATDVGARVSVTQITSAPAGFTPFSAGARPFSDSLHDDTPPFSPLGSQVLSMSMSAGVPFAPMPQSPLQSRSSSQPNSHPPSQPSSQPSSQPQPQSQLQSKDTDAMSPREDAYLQSIAMDEYLQVRRLATDELNLRAAESPVNLPVTTEE